MLEIIENEQIISPCEELQEALAQQPEQVCVSLQQWRESQSELIAARQAGTRVVVELAPHDGPSLVADHLEYFDIVQLQFTAFTDGRPFSIAHLLRNQHGYRGVIRAVGDILPDQLAFLARCGIDQAVLPDNVDTVPFLQRFPRTYQHGFGNYQHIRELRRGRYNRQTLEQANGD